MTLKPTSIASLGSQNAVMSRARRDEVQPAARAAGRHTQLALVASGLWLLLAIAVNAAGEGVLGICFAGLAVLWISIAAVENHGTRVPSATQTLRGQIRWQAARSGS
jgi:hypothetical protein